MIAGPAFDDAKVLVRLCAVAQTRMGSVVAELAGLNLVGLETVVEGPPEVGSDRERPHAAQNLSKGVQHEAGGPRYTYCFKVHILGSANPNDYKIEQSINFK